MTSGRSTHIPASRHIVLASDVTALSKPNAGVLLVVNRPCSNRADGGDGAWGALPLDADTRPLYRLAVVTVVSVRGGVDLSIVACPAWGNDHVAMVGQWRC